MRKDAGTTKVTMDHFMSQVYPEPNTGCWLWGGKVAKSGHGKVFYKNLHLFTAHRASYYFHNGNVDNNQCVLHKCDVACCVNPDHLYLGSRQQNVLDRDSRNRGRWNRGDKNHRATISEETAHSIKRDIQIGLRLKDIATKYNVNKYLVSDIRRGKTWTHI